MNAASMDAMVAGSVTGIPTAMVPRAVFDPAPVGRRRPPGLSSASSSSTTAASTSPLSHQFTRSQALPAKLSTRDRQGGTVERQGR